MDVIGHTAYAVEFSLMAHDVAMDIGIKLTFMLLIDCRNAATSAKNDMIYEMGIAHVAAKVSIITRLHNYCQAMGSPSATRSHDALPAVPPLSLASLGFAGGTAGY